MPKAARVYRPHPRVTKPDNRPPSSQRGYGAKWRKAKDEYIREHPWCAICAKEGRRTSSQTVDHIIAHKGDMKLFWDRKNWQPACLSCNSRKAATSEGGFGHKGHNG